MRQGALRRLRSSSLSLLVTVTALAMSLLGPGRVARARVDPLNVITVQIQRANILVVLDTSGSMSWRPEDNQNVGGDCYQGANCTTTALPDTCPSGQTCSPANTCTDGHSGCTSGVASYCDDGSRCLPGRVCGTAPNLTLCPSTVASCRDGSACIHLCTDGVTPCSSNADCPPLYRTCGAQKHCQGDDNASATCTSDSQCTVATCNTSKNPNRCENTSYCSSGSNCYGASTCNSNQCRWTNSPECTSNADCRKCVATCIDNRNTICTNPGNPDPACGTISNTCDLSTTACPASTGSTTCGYWCPDGTACSSTTALCTGSGGQVTACTRVCPDGGSCFTSKHCGADACPATSNVYRGSSRLAIAKYAISSVMAETKNIANFGFMTFNQTGYFPYVGGSTSTRTYVEYFKKGWLKAHGGWDWANDRPLAQFTSGGRTYTIECASGGSWSPSPCTPVGTTVYTGGGSSSALPAGNSQYHFKGNDRRMDYCGEKCSVGGHTWKYRGSYYTYTRTYSTGSTYKFESTYKGPSFTSGGTTYVYFEYPIDYWGKNYSSTSGFCYDYGYAPVCGAASAGSSCSDTSRQDGRTWLMPSLSDDQAVQDAQVAAIAAWLAPQSGGGVVARGYTPSGCTLQYASSGSTTPSTPGAYYDAYSAMAALKASDPAAACRKNAVLFVTDGEPNGPGDDSTCGDVSKCGTDSLSGCTCKSVLAAKNLWQTLGVKAYVVGFGAETKGSATLDNIARAGGSPMRADGHYAFYAMNEDDLVESLRTAVYEVAKGDYTTSAPTVATSSTGTAGGDVALLASAEFPSFRGHLRAFRTVDSSGNALSTPQFLWDAGQKLASRAWNTRRVFTSNSSNQIVPFLDGTGQPNATALHALGLGSSDTEAASIISWTLGSGRSWPLGAFLNSTPMTHGTGLEINMPGHAAYQAAMASGRPKMVYVGADDGMLHAFYLEDGSWGSGGDEAWAYVPPDLLPRITDLYLNGGQTSDPASHVYGVNSSPKINDVCTGSCSSQADWKTVLVAGEGPGGTGYFVLDISGSPTSAAPFSVLWHSAYVSSFLSTVGQSWSVPAFAYVSSPTTSVLLFGSGYDGDPGDGYDQGSYLHVVNALTGSAVLSPVHITPPSSPVTTYAVLADTAVALQPSSYTPAAAYQADLGGRVWRLAHANTAPGSTPLHDSGAAHPYHYSPAVIATTGTTVYLALNDMSADDPEVAGGSVVPYVTILKDDGGTKVAMTLTANGVTRTNSMEVTNLCKTGCVSGTCSCSSSSARFTAAARPASSPLLLENLDGSGQLQALFLIYQPPTVPCTQGESYLVVFDINDTAAGQTAAVSLGPGKAGGVSVDGGGQVLVARSGASGATIQAVTTATPQPPAGGIVPVARVVGVMESDN